MQYLKYLKALSGLFLFTQVEAQQLSWLNVDSLFGALPSSVHVYKSAGELDGKPNLAYYISADLSAKELVFTTDTGKGIRYTPLQFYARSSNPLIIVNGTF